MIDYNKAKDAFEKYLDNFDREKDKTQLKIIHTYGVVKYSEYISKDLNLSDEDIELAKLIALLHDIGRFEQIVRFDNFVDHQTIDHADFGVEILFNENMIRDFIEDDKYDEIIKKAISNHNKYKIEEGLSGQVLLHSQIIRDADKTDNFRVKAIDDFMAIADMEESVIVKEVITDEIYNTFMKEECIVSNRRKTFIDMWVSYIAFIFDYNFSSGLKYIKEKDYINVLVDRIDYQNEDTKKKMEEIRMCAINYIEKRISNG